jgi:hypothetical protein
VQLAYDTEFHRVYGWARRRDPEGIRKSPDGFPLPGHKQPNRPILKDSATATATGRGLPSSRFPPRASPVVFYCGPREFLVRFTFRSPNFSHLTPPRIYIFPRPHLSLPTPAFLEIPPGASHLPAAASREVSEACSPCSSLLAFGLFQPSTW